MLCGAPPFQAETREAVLAKHLTETAVPMRSRRSTVPEPVDAMVMLALSKAPESRPPMQTILNRLWEEANHPAKRWKRMDAIIAGGALATLLAVVAGWVLLAPAPAVPPPLAQPEPPPAQQVPLAAPLPSKDPSPETRTAPTLETPGPAATPSSARATPPPAAPRPRAERPEQQRVPQSPAGPASERPAAASNTDDPDPGAFVDWVLEQRGAARRGK
jgi:hypothetical protein